MKKGRTKLSDRIKEALLTTVLAQSFVAVLTTALTPEEQPKQQREPREPEQD